MSAESKRLFQEAVAKVKSNSALLEGCPAPRHDFRRTDRTLFAKWRCAVCGGEVDTHGVFWYRKGLAHGPRNSEKTL